MDTPYLYTVKRDLARVVIRYNYAVTYRSEYAFNLSEDMR